jgi:hypothetical protein
MKRFEPGAWEKKVSGNTEKQITHACRKGFKPE